MNVSSRSSKLSSNNFPLCTGVQQSSDGSCSSRLKAFIRCWRIGTVPHWRNQWARSRRRCWRQRRTPSQTRARLAARRSRPTAAPGRRGCTRCGRGRTPACSRSCAMRLSPMCRVVRCSMLCIFQCPQCYMHCESMLTVSQCMMPLNMTNMIFWKWL